jgi:tRNA-dihydrouridine synthase B
MLYIAPIQGYTDFIYRSVYNRNFRCADAFFIPYLSMRNEKLLKKQMKEVFPVNNKEIRAVPQILVKNSDEANYLSGILEELGYKEVNLNMGCPYPMVTNGGRGAGLLPFPERICQILDSLCNNQKIRISVKLRSGLTSEDEIINLIDLLNSYPLSEIIYHPRIASQLYKGDVNESLFGKISGLSKHPVCYNGNVFSRNDFEKKKILFPGVQNWMLGRGILMNPFLTEEISGFVPSDQERAERFQVFHNQLVEKYSEVLSGPGHLLTRLKLQWEYLCHSFPEPEKTFKTIRKCNNLEDYLKRTGSVIDTLKRG